MFTYGFNKVAAFGRTKALINKIKGMFTGKDTFYHNTSSKNARRILDKGLIPTGGAGVFRTLGANKSDELVNRTARSYMSTNPDIAKGYGRLPYLTRALERSRRGGGILNMIKKIIKAPRGRQLKIEIPKSKLGELGVDKSGPIVTAGKTISKKYIRTNK